MNHVHQLGECIINTIIALLAISLLFFGLLNYGSRKKNVDVKSMDADQDPQTECPDENTLPSFHLPKIQAMKLSLAGYVAVIIILLSILLSSCTTYRCYPSKRSRDWGNVQPMESGTIADANNYRRTTLVSVRKTMRGFKHFFLTDESDTVYLYLYPKLRVGECYLIKNFLING